MSGTIEPLTPDEEDRLAHALAGPDGVVMAHIPGRFLWVEAPPRDGESGWWGASR